ncbi:MAG: BppU family phage baseplate upper protein [Sarcina sp.]
MALNNIKATINCNKVNYSPISVVKEEDTILLELSILKNDTLLDLTEQTISISALRNDNELIHQESFITISKTTFKVLLNNSFNAIPGIVRCEITIKNDEGIVTTADFYLRVSDRIMNNKNLKKSGYVEALEKVKNEFIESSTNLLELFKNDSATEIANFFKMSIDLRDEFLVKSEEIRKEFKISSQEILADFLNSTKNALDQFDAIILENIEIFKTEANLVMDEVRRRGEAVENYFKSNIDKFKGEPGRDGIDGAPGLNGVDGIDGKNGLPGTPGQDGLNGKDAIVIDSFEGGNDVALAAEKGKELNIRLEQVEDFSMMYQERNGEGSATWTNSYIGDIKDLVIKGKTIGGYNAETAQSVPITSSAELEENKIIVRSCGKNLFNVNKMVGTSHMSILDGKLITKKLNAPYSISNLSNRNGNNIIRLKKNTKYILSADITTEGIGGLNYLSLLYYNKDGNLNALNQNYLSKPTNGAIKVIITTSDSEEYFIGMQCSNGETIDLVFTLENIQIEEGTIASKYEPYVENKVEVQLPFEGGLKNVRSIRDELNLDNGLATYKIGIKRFDAKDEFILNGVSKFIESKLPIPNCKGDISGVFSHLNFDILGASVANNPVAYFITTDGKIRIKPFEKNDMTLQEGLDWIKANTPVLVYELITPTVHNIEKVCIKSFKGTTHLIQENEIAGNVSAKVKVDLSAETTRLENENIELKNDTSFLAGTLLSILEATALPEGEDEGKRKLLQNLLEIKERT